MPSKPLVLVLCLCAAAAASDSFAADKEPAKAGLSIVQNGDWLESDNFVLHLRDETARTKGRSVLLCAERCRSEIYERWDPKRKDTKWSARCNLFLADGRVSLQDGRFTTGLFEQRLDPLKKYVSSRSLSLDISTGLRPDYRTHELPHEVTHAVLYDLLFPDTPLRWADEGAAMMSEEGGGKLHLLSLAKRTADKKRKLTVSKILDAREYPAQDQIQEFYELGHALTRHLVEAKDCATFVKFLRCSNKDGCHAALRTIYGYESIAALEKDVSSFIEKQR